MKAMAITSFGKPLEMITIEDPVPGNGEVVLSVLAAGVCYTDIKVISGFMARGRKIELPLIPGHEIIGAVERIGPEVEGWKIGDKAVVVQYVGCGSCSACQSGYDAFCPNIRYQIGFSANGGYAEKVKVPAHNLVRVSSVVPDEQMAILPCAMATAYHGVVDRAKVEAGDRVMVVGVGGVGNLVAQLALLRGGHVIAVDIDEAKLDMAREVGVNETYNVSGSRELPASVRVNKIIEVSGAVREWEWLFNTLEVGGVLVLVGYGMDTSLTIGTAKIIAGNIEIKGTRGSSRAHLINSVSLVESGKIKPLVSSVFPLAEANEVLSKLATHKLSSTSRAVLVPR